jgi:tetratricopeptide (TPR) repeat protein
VADRHWRAIAEAEPSNAEALLGLALALQEQGRMEEALARYRAVLAREPRRYYEVVKTLSGAARGFLLLRPSALRHLLMD